MAILKPMIMKDCPAINAIEPTCMTDDSGKWTLGTTQETLKDAQAWIDTNLQLLMDTISPDDKPSLPKAITPQRIISYAAVSDSQLDNLLALAGLSTSAQPTVNAWCSPPLTAPTPPSPLYPTLSASQPTVISELVTKITLLESQLVSQNTTIDENESKLSALLSAQTINLQSLLDERITPLQLASNKQSATITRLQSQVDVQQTTIASINDRIDVFENNISSQIAPLLTEAAQAGGLAELIQHTVLGCLNQKIQSISRPKSTYGGCFFPHASATI
jgi:uncharacterized coiled-coil protein SlyX